MQKTWLGSRFAVAVGLLLGAVTSVAAQTAAPQAAAAANALEFHA